MEFILYNARHHALPKFWNRLATNGCMSVKSMAKIVVSYAG